MLNLISALIPRGRFQAQRFLVRHSRQFFSEDISSTFKSRTKLTEFYKYTHPDILSNAPRSGCNLCRCQPRRSATKTSLTPCPKQCSPALRFDTPWRRSTARGTVTGSDRPRRILGRHLTDATAPPRSREVLSREETNGDRQWAQITHSSRHSATGSLGRF